jgi:nudix-type nucleoside diphosphatase (YffH/AdpP family)
MPVQIRKLETVHQGYLTIMSATLAASDGSTFTREIEHHGNAVAVLPYDAERRTALLVRQPRAPVIWSGGPPELLEAIAGMIDSEDPQECVRREALEEAGVRLAALEPLGAPWASPGVSSERMHLFLAPYAARDRIAAGGGSAEEHEHITVVEVPLAQLWGWVEGGVLEDLKTLALTLALKARRPELFAARDAKSFTTGWLVDPRDREDLLGRFAPRYAEVVAHHVTFKSGGPDTPLPAATEGEIVGEADDGEGVQALVVSIGGTTDRPDGSTYHITWSLGAGRDAIESNPVIAERGWRTSSAVRRSAS